MAVRADNKAGMRRRGPALWRRPLSRLVAVDAAGQRKKVDVTVTMTEGPFSSFAIDRWWNKTGHLLGQVSNSTCCVIVGTSDATASVCERSRGGGVFLTRNRRGFYRTARELMMIGAEERQ